MPIPVPVLDDRRFDDLVAEARAMIPAIAPDWTNHNPSDPGITLVELFAYLTETLIYRLDRVTPAHTCAFLNLLDGGARTPAEVADLRGEIRDAIAALRRLDRAVSARDFETLALDPAALPDGLEGSVARVRCVPRRNLQADPSQELAAHVSIVVQTAEGVLPDNVPWVLANIAAFLEPRRLLTTRLHVVAAVYVDIGIQVAVAPAPDWTEIDVKDAVANALVTWLDPYPRAGGPGWPFGRAVYASEIFAVLSRVPGVNYVESVTFGPPIPANRQPKDGSAGVVLQANELVTASVDVTVVGGKGAAR